MRIISIIINLLLLFLYIESFIINKVVRYNHKLLSINTNNEIISYNLENSILTTDLINKSDDLQGVYVIENKNGDVLHVSTSNNVISSIKLLYNKFGFNEIYQVRIQQFNNDQIDLMKAYSNELISLSKPIVNKEEWDLIANQSKANKLDILKNKVLQMRSQSNEIVSPFQSNTDISSESKVISLSDESETLELTYENVDKVLNEVRPYLIADGGNVSVVSVDSINSIIQLELVGACGSCPSSTTTMKMGIERILKENFPYIKLIESINKSSQPELTIDVIDKALQPVLPTITKLGGFIRIQTVDPVEGNVVIEFKGPLRLKQGIQLILKDIKLVNNVIFIDINE